MKRPLRLLAPLLWMALIFIGSSQSDPSPGIGNLGHVVAHFTEYAILAALWFWALTPTESGASTAARLGSASLGRRAVLAAAAISVLYAISDEFHQSFVPDRDSDPVDVLVDSCGVAVALAISYASAARAASRRRATSP